MEKKPNPKVVSVTLNIPRRLVDEIDASRRRMDRSRSAEIRQLLVRALETQEKTA